MHRDQMDLDDYRWLTGEEGQSWLTELAGLESGTVAIAARLRKNFSSSRTHLLLEQVALRQRAARKFRSAAAWMFFTPRGLEQATDPVIADYKASRFSAGQHVADLCCGIGGDLLGLARRGIVLGIERDPAAALLAEANLRGGQARGLLPPQTIANVQVADVEEFDSGSVAAWHIDPDRRPAGRRTTRVELHQPGPDAIDRLRRACPQAAIKLAPAAALPDGWESEAELEWVSHGGECKQLVAWFGGLTQYAGSRRATMVGRDEAGGMRDEEFGHAVLRTMVGRGGEAVETAERLGRFMYEPDAAVLAADLRGALAQERGLRSLEPGIAYLTGDTLVDDPALAAFEVQEVLPFSPRKVRSLLAERRIGRLEVKQRGTGHDANALARQWKCAGDQTATVIVTRICGKVTAILTRRAPALGGLRGTGF